MNEMQKILLALDILTKRFDALEKHMATKEDVKQVEQKITDVDLKVEAVHAELLRTRTEIADMLVDGFEAEGSEQRRLQKRLDDLEERVKQLEQARS